jgi:hypothetical protein
MVMLCFEILGHLGAVVVTSMLVVVVVVAVRVGGKVVVLRGVPGVRATGSEGGAN